MSNLTRAQGIYAALRARGHSVREATDLALTGTPGMRRTTVRAFLAWVREQEAGA